jgi:Ca2+-binding RTX toxin-like protein
MTLTVSNVSDGAFEVLGFDGSNIALTNGNAVTTATNGLNVTVSLSSGTATLTFSGAALSAAQLQTLVDGITYINTSQDPTDADRVITITQLTDSGANGGADNNSLSPNISATVNVDPVNDGPGNSVPGMQTFNEGGSVTFSTGNGNAIVITDVDADPADVTVTLTIADGALTLNAGALAPLTSFSGNGSNNVVLTGTVAEVNAALNGLVYTPPTNANGGRTLNVSTTDNGNSPPPALQDSDNITINITSVNDAPAGADNTVTGSEDDPYVFTAADFGFSDPNDSPANTLLAVRITTLPAVGTLFFDADGPGGAAPVAVAAGQFIAVADINAGHLYFQPVTDQYGNAYASFTFQVQDNGGTANSGVDLDQSANTITINVTPDNLAPVVDLNGGGAGINNTTSFTEDGAAVTIGTGATVADQDLIPNNGSLVSMTVTLTDKVAGDSLTFNAPLPGGFSATTTTTAGSIQIVVSGTGTGAQYTAILNSIVYSTTSQNPDVFGTDTARTITVVTNDGALDSATATATVNIVAIDDAPVAQPDAFTITESGTITAGNLFASNGSGADTDPDGPPLAIAAVNGSGANVGMQIMLASGALLTVNSNGTFDYNPNGAFLPTPTAGSGASNTPGHDSFTYTLAGGNTATVTITLTGLDTDDLLLGTAGTDVLMGGNGNDTYVVTNASDVVVENAGQGSDTVYATVSYQLMPGSEVERLSTIDWSQTTAINLTGNAFSNLLEGNAGVNVLNGGGGADVMHGFGGDDIYVVDNAGDQPVENAGQGNDVVYALISYQLAPGTSIERLSTIDWSQTAAINLTGNELNNLIEGNAGANVLNGAAGADVMVGFGGNDIYVVDDAGDQTIETAGQGSDIVYALVDYTLAAGANVERLSSLDWTSTNALNLTGNGIVNLIEGNAGANILDGGGGADALVGFGGNDTYYVDQSGDNVYEAVGGGNDAVYSSSSYALTAGQEIELLLAADFNATTALNLTGNEFANTIYGNAGANILDGKGGNDSLVGQQGADTYAFTTALGAANVDVVFGFEHNVDKIALDDAIFSGIGTPGSFSANAFVVGSAALDANDRIIYDNLTGQLLYDADGTGAGAAVQFATLSPGLTLTASDFTVI